MFLLYSWSKFQAESAFKPLFITYWEPSIVTCPGLQAGQKKKKKTCPCVPRGYLLEKEEYTHTNKNVHQVVTSDKQQKVKGVGVAILGQAEQGSPIRLAFE